MTNKETIYNFLKHHKYMTLATASKDGKPEAATVEFTTDGDDLLINSYISYRKYDNLVSNPRVACVVTEGDHKTLQFDCNIIQLSGADAEEAKQKLIEFEPAFKEYFEDPDTRLFRLTPYWMRLRDYTKIPESELVYES